MINNKTIINCYQQLSEKERALLMIHANINDDDQEFKRLRASAPTKTFKVWSNKESEIGNAWIQVHRDFLILKNFLYRKLLMVGNLLDNDDLQFNTKSLLLEHVALDLAFINTLKFHSLPVDEPLLKVFSCDIYLIDLEQENIEDIVQGALYKGYAELFSGTCKNVL